MNNNNYLEFKKERDLGAIITDTFKFFRLEWKPFFTTVFKIALLPILFAIAGVLYYSFEQANLYSSVDFADPNSTSPTFGLGLVLAMFVMLIAIAIALAVINVASMYYIKSYVDNKGNVKLDEVKQNVKNNFWAFIGLGILTGIIVGIGTMFCFLPGVYLFVVLSLATSIYVFREKSVMDAISYSFEFVKDHWWPTFGVLIVMVLLVGVLGSIFSIPALIYMMGRMFTGAVQEDPTQVMGVLSDPIYVILTIVSYLGKFLFSAVTLVSTVLIYFDINEQKYASGTIEKIDSIGQ